MQDTILLVHHDVAFLETMVTKLSDMGHHVLSPSRTAAMALAIVAQTPATLAIVGQRLAGRRDGQTLVRALQKTWGLPSLLLADDDPATASRLAIVPNFN